MSSLLNQYACRIKSHHTSKFDEHKLAMLKLMRACPGMRVLDRVLALRNSLPSEVASQVPACNTGDDLLRSVYNTCVDYEPNMSRLFIAFDDLMRNSPDHPAVRDVDWALRDIVGGSTFTRDERDEMLLRFRDARLPHNLYGLYRKVSPAGPDIVETERGDLWSILYALSQQPPECVDRFLVLLFQACRSTIRNVDMPDWFSPLWEEAQSQQQALQPNECAHFVIEINPSDDGSKFDFRFTMEIAGTVPITSQRFLDGNRQDVETALDVFLLENVPTDRPLLVEFLVPKELVGNRWELLRITIDAQPMQLAHYYPVVFRIQGRDRHTHAFWRNRWNRFYGLDAKDLTEEGDGGTSHWLWIGGTTDSSGCFACPEHTEHQFQQKLLVAENCGLAAFEVIPNDNSDLSKYLSRATVAGLPILIGRYQHACGVKSLKAQIFTLLHPDHRQLPGAVQKMRQAGMIDDTHWAGQLTLIWDDPNRVPKLVQPPQ